MLSLTQGHLKQLEVCLRRYQYIYLDQYTVPSAPEQWAGQDWGAQFHRVMQQRELGLPVAELLRQNADLGRAVDSLVAAAPELFTPQPDSFRQSEHQRTLPFNGYLLTAVYDLLVLGPGRGDIVDWKTYQTPSSPAQLAKQWQTRLYQYLLVETSDLTPAQVTMTYWFVPPPTAAEPLTPSRVTLTYTPAQHRRTAADLQRLSDHLTAALAAGGDLPQVDPAAGYCTTCPFAVRCQRGGDRDFSADRLTLPAIADIAEIPL